MPGLIASMIIGTVFGWVWLFVAFTNSSVFPNWARFVVTAIAILLVTWTIVIRRISKRKSSFSPTTTASMFKTRSYRLIVIGETLAIFLAVFTMHSGTLQTFLPSAIAIIVTIHFLLLGWSVRTRYLRTIGWIMLVVVLLSDVIYTPLSYTMSVQNRVAVGSGMGIVLWASVITSAVRITRLIKKKEAVQ